MDVFESTFSGSQVEALLKQVPGINNTGKRTYVLGGVIRYNSSTQNWYQIGGIHEAVNTTSILMIDDTTIEIVFPLTGVANKKVVSFIVAPDETLSGLGLICGASVGVDSAYITCYATGYSAYITYSGSEWTQLHGSGFPDLSLAWSTNKLVITVPWEMTTENYSWPTVCGKDTPHQTTLGSCTASTVDIIFYNAAGTKVTTPDTNMKFFIKFGALKMKLRGDTIPNDYGNLWYMGMIDGDQ